MDKRSVFNAIFYFLLARLGVRRLRGTFIFRDAPGETGSCRRLWRASWRILCRVDDVMEPVVLAPASGERYFLSFPIKRIFDKHYRLSSMG
jgi:hypothetical protein